MDISQLSSDVTHNFDLPLLVEDDLDTNGTIRFNLSISGAKEDEKDKRPLELCRNYVSG